MPKNLFVWDLIDMHHCMGWSSSGGSWITPELSMQQMVWNEAFIEGA
jgi:hypothetical protein